MKKISARNALKGKIVDVKKGTTTAHVTIDIGGPIVTAAITNESVDELKLAPGQPPMPSSRRATSWWELTNQPEFVTNP